MYKAGKQYVRNNKYGFGTVIITCFHYYMWLA